MALLKLMRGVFRVEGRMPAEGLSETTAVELVAGRRAVEGTLREDGGYAFEFSSRRRVLWVTVYGLTAKGGRRRLGGQLCVNVGRRDAAESSDLARQLAQYDYCLIPEVAAGRKPPEKGTRGWAINWIIPDIGAGAGGLMTIFQLARELERRGHRHTFWIMGRTRHPDPQDYVVRNFLPLAAEFRVLPADGMARIEGDLVVATNDVSAYHARGVGGVAAKAYLVQDYEPMFYPAGTGAILSAATYGFGFKMITAGPWLQKRLAKEGARAVRAFDLTYDPAAYFEAAAEAGGRLGAGQNGRRHIAFYARATTPRRAVPLGIHAFIKLAEWRKDFTVHLYGQKHGPLTLPFAYEDHGVLAPAELGALYRRCDVGVVFSASNHSLVPREMMACGLPVVELAGEQNETVYAPGSIVLAAAEPAAIAVAVARLLDEPEHANAMRAAGRAQSAAAGWARSAAAVEAAMGEALRGE